VAVGCVIVTIPFAGVETVYPAVIESASKVAVTVGVSSASVAVYATANEPVATAVKQVPLLL
jgi:hypothetical protein